MATTCTAWTKNSYGFREITFTFGGAGHAEGTSLEYPDHVHSDLTIVFNPTGVNYTNSTTLSWDIEVSYDGGTTWVTALATAETAKVIDTAAYRFYYERTELGALPKFRITADPSAALGTDAELEVLVIPN